MITSSTHPEASSYLIGLLESDGIPLSKAAYLFEMLQPDIPELPVPDHIAALIPDTLPGELPTTYRELLDALKPAR